MFDNLILKRARKAKGFTYAKLGELTNSSKSYMWELENREGLEPSGSKVFLIAKALDVDMESFYQQYVVSLYGYCPLCGVAGTHRERRINGRDTCGNGHVYPSSKANLEPQEENNNE